MHTLLAVVIAICAATLLAAFAWMMMTPDEGDDTDYGLTTEDDEGDHRQSNESHKTERVAVG